MDKECFRSLTSRCIRFGNFDYGRKSDEQIYSDSSVVIVGVPYDGTATYLGGGKYGPEAVLSASVNLETFDEVYGNIYDVGVATAGIINLEDINSVPERIAERVYTVCRSFIADGKFIVAIGGEHSITLGVVKAYNEKLGDISVLQLDAHLDLFDTYGGSKYNHACVMRRVRDDCGCMVTHVGTRVVAEDEYNYIKQSNCETNIFRASETYNNSNWFDKAIDSLNDNVYITVDVDVFNPALMPATGTPVPGGLDWYVVLDFLRNVYMKKRVVGFDVTELKPNPGNEAPNFLVADLVYKNIGFYKKYVLKR